MYDIALVGSGGFLGSAIARALTARENSVVSYTRQSPVYSDGCLDDAAASASVLVWAAGGISPTVAQEHPALVRSELDHFRQVMDAVAAQPAPPRVVLLSSGGTVYGQPAAPPFREDDDPQPANAYGEYKLAQERVLDASGVVGTSLRVANAYGPGQQGARGQGVLAIWMRSVLAGEPIRIHGSGAVARDYVFVDDVAEAVAHVVDRADAPRALNIGSGQPTPLDDLVAHVVAVVGESRVIVDRMPSRGVDADSTWLDVTLARDRIGWMARTPLADGVGRMWRWIESS